MTTTTTTTRDEKPIVVLVHGACHTPGHFHLLIQALRKAEYRVIAPSLATTGWDDRISGKTWADDVALLHSVVDPLLDEGRQAIVLGHSYGGIVITHFAVGHSVAERAARGQKGGVAAVLYLAALALPAGKAITDVLGTSPIVEIDHSTMIAHCTPESAPFCYGPDLAQVYPGVEGEAAARAAGGALISLCAGQSIVSTSVPATCGASDVAAAKTYLVCALDKAVLPAVQRELARSSGAGRVVELEAGHSAFLVGRHVDTIVQEIDAAAAAAAAATAST